MIYDRKPFTDWVVEVLDYEEEGEFIGFYRTTFSDGKECEQFTLIYEHDSDELLVQVRIYKNGDIMVGNLVPSNVMVYRRKKLITIELLCDISVDKNGNMSIIAHDEYA